jgi:hypothetical protein
MQTSVNKKKSFYTQPPSMYENKNNFFTNSYGSNFYTSNPGTIKNMGMNYTQIPKGLNISHNYPSHAAKLGRTKKMASFGTLVGGIIGATTGASTFTSGILAGANVLGAGSFATTALAGAGSLAFAFPMVAGMIAGTLAVGSAGIISPVIGKATWGIMKNGAKLMNEGFHYLSNNSREKIEQSIDKSATKSRLLTTKQEKNLQRQENFAKLLKKVKEISEPEQRMAAINKLYDLKVPTGTSMRALNRAYSQHLISQTKERVDITNLKEQISTFAKEKGLGKMQQWSMKAELSKTIEDYKDKFLIDKNNTIVNPNIFQPNKKTNDNNLASKKLFEQTCRKVLSK